MVEIPLRTAITKNLDSKSRPAPDWMFKFRVIRYDRGEMKLLLIACLAVMLTLLTGCGNSTLKNTARTLNRDLDLVKSPYQYTIAEDKEQLIRVLRKMPVGETAADATLRVDVEKAIAAKLGASAKIVEVRVFETQPNLRREVWVAEQGGEKMAFDVVLRAGRSGADYTVEGPVIIQGAL